MTEAKQDDALFEDLTAVVRVAQRGFKRDVAKLVEQLPRGGLHVPLAESVDNVRLGETVEPEEEVTLKPHLLPAEDGVFLVPLFTDPDVLTTVGGYLDWATDRDDDLQYCTLPAPVALDLALQLVDEESVVGAVINPSDQDHELVLRRHELGALCQSQAIPLVGYVDRIPVGDDEDVLVSELERPPSSELITAIEACVNALNGVDGYALSQTFNPERDLEPHLTLTLKVSNPEGLDADELNGLLASELEGKLPDPGYVDVLFDTGDANAD
jgi:hypothetical protein